MPQADRRARLETVLAAPSAPDPPDPGDPRPVDRGRLVRAVRGRRPRRGDRQAARGAVPARQAGDVQDQAPAHGRLRRGRVPLAQERARDPDRVAPARAVRRRGPAPPRRGHRHVHDGPASRAGDRARAVARPRAGRPSVGGMGGAGPSRGGARSAGARCDESLEPRSRPVLGAAPAGARRARWPSTTCRAIGSGTGRRSCAGDRTSDPRIAATTSWPRRRPTSCRRSSAPPSGDADLPGCVGDRSLDPERGHGDRPGRLTSAGPAPRTRPTVRPTGRRSLRTATSCRSPSDSRALPAWQALPAWPAPSVRARPRGRLLDTRSAGRSRDRAASCGGRSASGTWIRLTRTRVHVVDRPRIESTRTSAGSSAAAAVGQRAFQRSRPARASSFLAARAISMTGIDDVRRPVGVGRRAGPASPLRAARHRRRFSRSASASGVS